MQTNKKENNLSNFDFVRCFYKPSIIPVVYIVACPFCSFDNASESRKVRRQCISPHTWMCGLALLSVVAITFAVLYLKSIGGTTGKLPTISVLWQWQASHWEINGLCSSRTASSEGWALGGFEQKLREASQELSGLGVTATLWEFPATSATSGRTTSVASGGLSNPGAKEVLQITVGSSYCTDVVWCNFTSGWYVHCSG
jgi:hypothetical protein